MISLKEQLDGKEPKNDSYFLVSIDGRGGAGKTTLSEYLSPLIPKYFLLHGDIYFEPTPGGRAFGTFNDERFVREIIDPAIAGIRDINFQVFDWSIQALREKVSVTIESGLIIDRWLSFALPIEWDLRIWVETPPSTTLARGLHRNDSNPEIEGIWRDIWMPQEERHIAKFMPQQTADIVLDGTLDFASQITG
jgi:hypothetical protein